MNTKEFITAHRNENVRTLALMGAKYPDVDIHFALEQIAGWQAARTKLPSWADKEGMIFPPHISMEQCSSEETAFYKLGVIRRLFDVGDGVFDGQLVDLTGGFGVDFSFLARCFNKSTYVEQQERLCEIAQKNFTTLGLTNVEVICGDGVKHLQEMKPVDLIYLDPARRDNSGGRTYALEDCTPNILELKDRLLAKAKRVMVKLSPMLDWHKAISDIGNVSEVHIVSVRNECKELLIVMEKDAPETNVFCVNDNCTETFTFGNKYCETLVQQEDIKAGVYLYEPNSSLMKGGELGLLSEKYGVKKIGSHSNLFVSDELIEFPGRRFLVDSITTMNKKDLRLALSGISKANIATRNFPLSPEELHKRLKLKDGGETYIFATTDISSRHILLICHKA